MGTSAVPLALAWHQQGQEQSFNAAVHSGSLLILTAGMLRVDRCPPDVAILHFPNIKIFVATARAIGMFLLAASWSDAEAGRLVELTPEAVLQAVLISLPAPLRRETAHEWQAELASSFTLLPWLRTAVADSRARIVAQAQADHAAGDNMPTEKSLTVRAYQQVVRQCGIEEIVQGTLRVSSANGLRAWFNRLMTYADGSKAPDDRPATDDLDGMIERSPYPRRVSKADSGYPYDRPPTADEEHPTVNCLWLADEYERLYGLQPDGAPLWSALAQLHAYAPPFCEALTHTLAAEGGQHFVVPPGIHQNSPAQLAQGYAIIHDLVNAGVLEIGGVGTGVASFDWSDPSVAAVFSPLFIAEPDSFFVPATAQTAADNRDVVALDALADAEAHAMYDQYLALVESGASPTVAFHNVMGERAAPSKRRLVSDNRWLNQPVYCPDHPFRYASWDDFLAMYHQYRYYAKADAAKFFYHIPLAEGSRKYFCGVFGDMVVRYKRIPMGFKLSPAIASILSGLLCLITRAQGFPDINAYVDDFLAGGVQEGHDSCDATLAALLANCKSANVLMSAEKTVLPTQRLVMVGGEVDSVADTLSLPMTRAYSVMTKAHFLRITLAGAVPAPEYHDDNPLGPYEENDPSALHDALLRGINDRFVQHIAGVLNWWAGLSFGGHCHLGGLYKAAHSGLGLSRTTKGALNDLTWWCTKWASGTMAPQRLLSGKSDLVGMTFGGISAVAVDAAGLIGGGAIELPSPTAAVVTGGFAVHRAWTDHEREHATVPWKEARCALDAFEAWGHTWGGRIVVIYTDNKGNAFNFNTGRSRSRASQKLIARMYAIAEEHGFEFVSIWLERQSNTSADALSNCLTHAEALALCSTLGLTLGIRQNH